MELIKLRSDTGKESMQASISKKLVVLDSELFDVIGTFMVFMLFAIELLLAKYSKMLSISLSMLADE
jgi:chromatin remodeling complex protein RSC6